MLATSLIVLAFGLLAGLVSSKPLESRNSHVYATFYNDQACSVGAGIAVNTANPGCLNEAYRESIYFQSGDGNTASGAGLVVSPSENCPCQSTCREGVGGSEGCYNLVENQIAHAPSYRFITGKCDPDNC